MIQKLVIQNSKPLVSRLFLKWSEFEFWKLAPNGFVTLPIIQMIFENFTKKFELTRLFTTGVFTSKKNFFFINVKTRFLLRFKSVKTQKMTRLSDKIVYNLFLFFNNFRKKCHAEIPFLLLISSRIKSVIHNLQ